MYSLSDLIQKKYLLNSVNVEKMIVNMHWKNSRRIKNIYI